MYFDNNKLDSKEAVLVICRTVELSRTNFDQWVGEADLLLLQLLLHYYYYYYA